MFAPVKEKKTIIRMCTVTGEHRWGVKEVKTIHVIQSNREALAKIADIHFTSATLQGFFPMQFFEVSG